MTSRYVKGALVLGCCAGLLCCGDGRRPVGEQVIGPSGGTIELDDTSAVLQVPAGALDGETELSLSRPPEGQLPTGAVAGTLVEIKPAGVTFEKAVKLTIRYNSANLPQKDTTWLRAVQLLPTGKLGATLFVAHDPAATTVTAKIVKGGQYLLADLQSANATMSTEQKKITDVDVLFVVDNSNSMADEQQNLANNFPKFIQKLDQAGLSYHVGVVSSDLGAGTYGLPSCEVAGGDGGKLWNTPKIAGCTPPTDPWIAKVEGVTNVPGGDASSAFSCVAEIGTGGCGFESTLESARRALDPQLGVNPGFVRKDAALAVVFLTDEDDCSAQKPQLFDPNQTSIDDPLGPLTSFRCFEFGIQCDINDRTQVGPRKNCQPAYDWLYKVDGYRTFFEGLKPPGKVMLAAIAGPTDTVEVGMDAANPVLRPSCQTAMGRAVPAIRIKALMDSFGPLGFFNKGKDASGNAVPVDICSSDFSPALSFLGDMVSTKVLTSWCLPYDPVDTNPLTAVKEADCVVVGSKAGPIPACTGTDAAACYRIESGATCSQSKSVLRIENADPASLGDQVFAVCLVL